jgi:hypothetical protein
MIEEEDDDNKRPSHITRGGEEIEKTKIYTKNPSYHLKEVMFTKAAIILLGLVFCMFFLFHLLLGVGLGKAGRKVIEKENDVSVEDFLQVKEKQKAE